MIRYKTIPANKTANGHEYQLNRWYEITEPLDICNVGFHCSKNIIDAMGYVLPGYIAKVEVRCKSIIQDDKECWSEIKILNWHRWTKKDSVSLAIYAAELVLKNYEQKYPNDLRPREAIEAAKKVLKNNTAKNRSAESAAGSAAGSAAESAWSAAWSAESAAASAAWSAGSAARSAAWSAAGSAESAARSAERQKTLNKCHQFVLKRSKL